MDELRILAPNGVCGSGFLETTFEKALALKPHFMGCDAGSTDPGPSHLGAVSREVIGACFNLPPAKVQLFFCDNAYAIKASIPRPYFQGDLLDSDGHGGQQYAPLMEIEIP